MSKRLRTEQEALSELKDAYRRYQEKRSGLGDELVAAIDVTLDLITRLPKAGAFVRKCRALSALAGLRFESFPTTSSISKRLVGD